MSLYLLNSNADDSSPKTLKYGDKYKTSINGDHYLSICVKALEQLVLLSNQAIKCVQQIEDIRRRVDDNQAQAVQSLSESYHDFKLYMKKSKDIAMAFIQDCLLASARDINQDVQASKENLEFLREQFRMMLTRFMAFSLSQDIKYAQFTVTMLKNILQIFKDCIEHKEEVADFI